MIRDHGKMLQDRRVVSENTAIQNFFKCPLTLEFKHVYRVTAIEPLPQGIRYFKTCRWKAALDVHFLSP